MMNSTLYLSFEKAETSKTSDVTLRKKQLSLNRLIRDLNKQLKTHKIHLKRRDGVVFNDYFNITEVDETILDTIDFKTTLKKWQAVECQGKNIEKPTKSVFKNIVELRKSPAGEIIKPGQKWKMLYEDITSESNRRNFLDVLRKWNKLEEELLKEDHLLNNKVDITKDNYVEVLQEWLDREKSFSKTDLAQLNAAIPKNETIYELSNTKEEEVKKQQQQEDFGYKSEDTVSEEGLIDTIESDYIKMDTVSYEHIYTPLLDENDHHENKNIYATMPVKLSHAYEKIDEEFVRSPPKKPTRFKKIEYSEEINTQNVIIDQIKRALRFCRLKKRLLRSKERIEAEKILLVETIKKGLLVNAPNLVEVSAVNTLGDIGVKNLEFTLKEPITEDFTYYFVCLLKGGTKVKATEVATSSGGTLKFQKDLRLAEVNNASLDLFSMRLKNGEKLENNNKCKSKLKKFFHKIFEGGDCANVECGDFEFGHYSEFQMIGNVSFPLVESTNGLKLMNTPLRSVLKDEFSACVDIRQNFRRN